MNNQATGKEGEDLASAYLEKKGYRILERNYRKQSGEIDIIALEMNEICFIEVKTRKSAEFGFPEEAIDNDKLARIVETAETWLEENEETETGWRIDAISIIMHHKGPSITHLKNISLDFDE